MSQRVEHVISAQGNNLSDLVNRYAEIEGVPAVGLLAGLIAESNLNEHAERIGTWPDWSEGLGQQTLLYANVGDHTASAANLKVVRDYYWQPEHAIAEAARQYGAYYREFGDHFEAWSRYNGGPGLAWADNPNQANIRRGWQAAQLYLAPDQEAAPMTYNPDTPPERQRQPWSCSIRTATWMLRALGVDIDAGRMQDILVPDYVTPELGLLQGDGSGLAAVLADQSGQATGHAGVSWDWLCAHAGTMPIGIGSPSLYHWVAVRALNDDGTLALANPAPGYQGLDDTMSEAQFDQWAPWAGVWIAVPATNGGDDLSAEERAELQRYREAQPYWDTLLGTPENPGGLIGSALGTLEQAAGTSKTHLAKVVREQCASVRQAAGV
jgi:hypothetical protein